jgi:hypothetical protein
MQPTKRELAAEAVIEQAVCYDFARRHMPEPYIQERRRLYHAALQEYVNAYAQEEE